MTNTCQGCGHLLRDHVVNIIGEYICISVHIDEAWGGTRLVRCDCVNGISKDKKASDEREAYEEYKQRELTKQFEELLNNG